MTFDPWKPTMLPAVVPKPKRAPTGLNPWDYAAKTRNEYAEQVALFMWANMAARFGVKAADDPKSYSVPGHAIELAADFGKPALPQLDRMFAIKNQGHGDVIRGSMSMAEGVKPGVPDICLPVVSKWDWGDGKRWLIEGEGIAFGRGIFGFAGLYIELKRLKSERGAKGKASKPQEDWQAYLRSEGYACEVVEGWEAATVVICKYLQIAR